MDVNDNKGVFSSARAALYVVVVGISNFRGSFLFRMIFSATTRIERINNTRLGLAFFCMYSLEKSKRVVKMACYGIANR